MSVGWVALGTSVVGSLAGADSARRANNTARDAADSDRELALKQLDQQTQSASDLLAFNKTVYEEGKTRQVGVDALNTKVVNQQMGIAKEASDRAAESNDFYLRNGRPVVQQAFDDAKNFDSDAEIEAARGRATADVNQGFASSQAQATRALQRMGINPNSGKFLALQSRMAGERAGALAGAANHAGDARRLGGVQLRQGAANLAQGIPGQAVMQGGLGVNAGNSASGVNNSQVQQSLALTGQALGGLAQGAQIYGSAANGYGNLYGQGSANASNIASANAQSQAGWGNLAGMGMSLFKPQSASGMQASFSQTDLGGSGFGSGLAYGNQDLGANFADGGKVTGPGTGTSDEVQAVNTDNGQRINLSNGEYVLSADTVKALGTKYLDGLQAKHHKPVNVGRAA